MPPRTAKKKKRKRVGARSTPRAYVVRAATAARRHGRLLALLGVLASLAAVLVLLVRWYGGRAGAGSGGITLSWPERLDAEESAALMADLGLVSDATAAALYLRATGRHRCIELGPHLVQKELSLRELTALLCRDGDRPRVKVTLPEGFSRFAMAERLEQRGVVAGAAFLRATEDGELLHALGVELGDRAEAASAEGYLFPATYELALDSTPGAVVRRLVEEGNRRWRELAAERARELEALHTSLGWSRREVLTLASMVEKETAAADERPIIASVFLNRLRDPDFAPRMLQSDPTSLYGCLVMPDRIDACRDWNGRPSPALNRDPHNVYSTYLREGLPPGPIANPGAASIAAVLSPATTRYLYFCADGDGHHVFTHSYDEHLSAVDRLRDKRR